MADISCCAWKCKRLTYVTACIGDVALEICGSTRLVVQWQFILLSGSHHIVLSIYVVSIYTGGSSPSSENSGMPDFCTRLSIHTHCGRASLDRSPGCEYRHRGTGLKKKNSFLLDCTILPPPLISCGFRDDIQRVTTSNGHTLASQAIRQLKRLPTTLRSSLIPNQIQLGVLRHYID